MWLFYEATAQKGNTRENLLITVFLDTCLPIQSAISRVFNRCRLTYMSKNRKLTQSATEGLFPQISLQI